MVRIQTENKWEKADTEEDGSYVTVSVPYGTAFAVYSVQDNSVPIWLILAIAAAAVLATFLIIKADKARQKAGEKTAGKRKKKKQQQTDSSNTLRIFYFWTCKRRKDLTIIRQVCKNKIPKGAGKGESMLLPAVRQQIEPNLHGNK